VKSVESVSQTNKELLVTRASKEIEVYLEIGNKRTFAGAIEWPGWCRSGRDEPAALQALCDYAPRYASVLRLAHFEFRPPADISAFTVTERLDGDATTDFGAPGKSPSSDTRPVDETELHRLQELLQACWQAFDAAASAASGKELRKGPRGGGRNLESVIQHVLGAEASYLNSLGGKLEKGEEVDLGRSRQAILDTLAAAARGEIPARGPRGGVRCTPRYFVRRMAWHVLDHAWELEDRIS
jgi:hypothetical protein